ncbi:MAG: hypothetical protein M3Z28_09045 [Candidatus Dormibacteraeota bacterium]|nr:hypothetical protein [Candidatus Dormibacteraeota bacterium]
MVIKMTNRLLGIVIGLALTSGIVAHAAQAPERPLAPITLPATLQTAASHVSETATSAVDPGAAIRAAYQRNRVALERLRQQASPLKGSARIAFNQVIADQELALTQTERAALATNRPDAPGAIAAMDKLVATAQAELNHELSQNGGANSKSSRQDGQSQRGESQGNNQHGKSQGGNSQSGNH